MNKKRLAKVKVLWTYLLSLSLVLAFMVPAIPARAEESQEITFSDYNEDAYDSFEEAKAASDEAMAAAGVAEPATIDDEVANSDDSLYDENSTIGSSSIPTYTTIDDATKYVREQMVKRASRIRFYITTNGCSSQYIYDQIMDNVFNETLSCKEGDYLRWNYAGLKGRAYNRDTKYEFDFTNVYYLSTYAQENAIDAKVKSLLNGEFAGWQNMHDYDKIYMVEEWVVDNFEYVDDGTDACHSTYSGIILHETVCQGYATTIYRLLREMGLSTRIVTSEDHGWNIVQLGRYYYYLDATWDDDMDETLGFYYYFLTADDTFVDDISHIREAECDTAEFHAKYPMASEDYYFYEHTDEISVYYNTHVQKYGWQNYVYDGATSGTEGESKRLEGIKIKLANKEDYDVGIEYRTHIQNYGWESEWRSDDEFSGTSGESKRLEAIQIRLTGSDADLFDVYYRVHAQNYGWLGWAKNGAPAGTAGQSKRLESIQILVLPKGENPGGLLGYSYVDYGKNSTSQDNAAGLVNYRTHVQTFGWQGFVYDGSISGTSALSKRLEGIEITLGDTGYEGGIQYTTHVQTYGWQGDKDNPSTWSRDGQMSGTSGESKRLEGIRISLYGEVANHYDVYYRVHAQTYGWLDWAKNGADAGTAGLSKRLEAIQIVVLPKGSTPPGSTATPFISK